MTTRIALALLATSLALTGCTGKNRDEASVENAVVKAYHAYTGHRAVSASCTYAEDNADGTEWWWCDVEANDPLGADPCTADVSWHADDRATARMRYCISDDSP